MKKFIFCTLVHGKKYINLSKTIAKQVANLGFPIAIYSTDCDKFNDLPHTDSLTDDSKLIKIIKNNNKFFSYHQKLEIAKLCIENYESVFYLDCDVEFVNDDFDAKIFENINRGLHIFSNFGSLNNFFLSDDISKCSNLNQRNAKYGREGLEFLKKNNYKFTKIYDGKKEDFIEHFLEGRWILKRDKGNELKFIEIWQKIREFCEMKDMELGYVNTIGAGEGGAMSIAAYNSGIKLNVISPLVTTINKNFISNYKDKVNKISPWNIPG